MKSNRVLSIVLNNFKNDSRVLKESGSLINVGYEVHVLALHESGVLERETTKNGLNIYRMILKSRSWSKNKFIQFLKYFEFLYRSFKEYRNSADIVHSHDLNALPLGVLLKRFSKNKVKLVYDAHEYEIERNGTTKVGRFFKKKLESFLIKYADSVITVSDSIADEYVRLYGIDKPRIIYNCPDFIEIKSPDLLRDKLEIRPEQKIFLYQGMFGFGRGIEMILSSFEGLAGDSNVLVCMGYGPLEDLIKKKANESKNIFFMPAVSPEELLEYTSSADVGIHMIQNTCLNHYYCMPNKIFEYLMAGLPVIVSGLYELKKFVNGNNVGVVIDENSTRDLSDAIEKIGTKDLSVYSKNIELVREEFNWKNQELTLLEIYRAL